MTPADFRETRLFAALMWALILPCAILLAIDDRRIRRDARPIRPWSQT